MKLLDSVNVTRAADGAAAVSIPAWIAIKWAAVAPILQGALLVLALVSTSLAIAVHLRKLRDK
jgi:hypothetical protein